MNNVTKPFKERLQKTKQTIDDFFTGKRRVGDETKYTYLCYGIAYVHVALAVIFMLCNFIGLVAYNMISAVIYFRLGIVYTRQKKFKFIFNVTFIEVIFYSCMVTLLAGWDWGFMVYIIALMPVSFYLSFTIPEFSKDLRKPFLLDLIAVFFYLFTKILCSFVTPIYPYPSNRYFLMCMYNFNAVIAFAILIVFGAFFAVEIRENEKSLQSQNDILVSMSSIDPLTGMLNRRSMDSHLKEVIATAKQNGNMFALFIGDIDDFKKVNDTYGHNIGDDVLVAVSKTIKENAPSNASICRWGGEEILVLIPDGMKVAQNVAEQIREAIAQISVPTDEGDIHVTMTFGLAEYTPGYSMTKLIADADNHLYFGKKHGKNCVVG